MKLFVGFSIFDSGGVKISLLDDNGKLKKKNWLKHLKAVLQKYRNDGPR